MNEHDIRKLLDKIADAATSLSLYPEHSISSDDTSEEYLETELNDAINAAVEIFATDFAGENPKEWLDFLEIYGDPGMRKHHEKRLLCGDHFGHAEHSTTGAGKSIWGRLFPAKQVSLRTCYEGRGER